MPIDDIYISGAVEGEVDEIIVRHLCGFVGLSVATIYGKNGKDALRRDMQGYNNAARHAPWIVLVDLDAEFDCAPPLRNLWLHHAAEFMCFRVAVHEVESWLIADAQNLSRFLRVRRQAIPASPETLPYPKEALVSIARQSRSRPLREDMVPRVGSGRTVGPAYTSRLIEFVTSAWSVRDARQFSPSLNSAIQCLTRLRSQWMNRVESTE